ncbi:GNAT family N-acetyltransferase [Clostridium sp. C2-6-12]|uniref:GNAT family N-acetyltransferase n=1 Tax=Clostridium sp. C2-6-12 TaxID=2698832 RepID=UPI001FADA653|nr:GNAT family N-acetyltransferase [Clostridium sp. C2-6-12]
MKNNYILKKLKLIVLKREILMNMETMIFRHIDKNEDITFRHFVEGEDEELRCNIQNSVFYDENRIPLSASDITDEEDEDYYINNFGVFLCKNDGQAIGYGQVIYSNGAYTIVNLGILKAYRQKGYGEMLLKYLIKLCYNNSIKSIYIKVERENISALSLYKKIGFKEDNPITSLYRKINLFFI